MAISFLTVLTKVLPFVPLVMKGIETIAQHFRRPDPEITQKIVSMPPITQEASTQHVIDIYEQFIELQHSMQPKIDEFEKIITDSITTFTSQLNMWVKDNDDFFSVYKIKLNRFQRRTLYLQQEVRGVFSSEVSKNLALTNPRCKALAKSMAGAKKEREFNELFESIIDNAIKTVMTMYEQGLTDIVEDFSDEIMDWLDALDKEINEQQCIYRALSENTDIEVERKILAKQTESFILHLNYIEALLEV